MFLNEVFITPVFSCIIAKIYKCSVRVQSSMAAFDGLSDGVLDLCRMRPHIDEFSGIHSPKSAGLSASNTLTALQIPLLVLQVSRLNHA